MSNTPGSIAHAKVDQGLSAHNNAEQSLADVQSLAVFVSPEVDASVVMAGAVGRTWGHCCELQQLWVAAEHRRMGLGTAVFSRFALEARQRRCDLLYLETFSFQAPAFYRALGCVVVLEVAGYTAGIRKFTMHLDLRGKANLADDPGSSPGHPHPLSFGGER